MRPVRQLKVITTKLEVLEDIKVQLEKLLPIISDVIIKGTTWIEETNSQPFDIVDYLLTDATTECLQLQKCLEIVGGNNESPLQSEQSREAVKSIPSTCSSTEDDKEYHKLKEKMDKMEKRYTAQKNRMNSMCQQFNDLEKKSKLAFNLKEKKAKETEMKFEEVMNELHAASNFMSRLQTQNESLAKQVMENEKQCKDMQQKVNFLEEQASAHSDKKDSFDSYRLNDLNEKLSKSKVSIDHVRGMTESLKTKVQNMESKLNSKPTGADSVQALSLNFATTKLSIENTLKDCAEKTEALQKKVTVYDVKIADFARQFIDVSQRIGNLESTDVPVAIDAMANFFRPMNLKRERIMTCFRNVIHDLQNNYNPQTGIFTVPVRGLYICSLGIHVTSDVPFDLEFGIHVKKSCEKEFLLALCCSKLEGHIVRDISVRELHVNDKVYVKPLQDIKHIHLSCHSNFFCALIQKM